MSREQTGPRNGMWRGGRTITTQGYVLVRVGTSHHLADVRGYAYEHRLVAEQVIGRRLAPGEQIHHRDGNRSNNAPENIEVMPSIAHHRNAECKIQLDRRQTGEPNPDTLCACGCGMRFPRFDAYGRPRRFVTGHNNPTGGDDNG